MAEAMRVTGCRVFISQTEDDRLKGFASIILNNEFAVCDLKIIRGNRGLFVAMPSRRRRDGTFHDVAHPIVQTLKEHIEEKVLEQYHETLAACEAGDTSYLPTALTPEELEYLQKLDPPQFS
jgi:stage V sporulation protein G